MYTFSTGTEAKIATNHGGTLEGEYECVQGNVALDEGLDATFQDDFQYGLFLYNSNQLGVSLKNYKRDIAEDALRDLIAKLPPWNAMDQQVVRDYRSIFTTYGTHVITSTSYGSRLLIVSLGRFPPFDTCS